jgi:hypothetical protein
VSGLVVLVLALLMGGGATWALVRLDQRIDELDAKLSVLARRWHPSARKDER